MNFYVGYDRQLMIIVEKSLMLRISQLFSSLSLFPSLYTNNNYYIKYRKQID